MCFLLLSVRQEEMKEIQETSTDEELEIQLGQRTSIENMNCTRIDHVSLEAKEQKEINNRTIKKMSEMTGGLSDGETSQTSEVILDNDDQDQTNKLSGSNNTLTKDDSRR